jgi:hypothetical protein
MIGLIDEMALSSDYDGEKLGQGAEKLVPSCPQVGAKLDSSCVAVSETDKGLQLDIEELIENEVSIGDLTTSHHNHILAASSQG